jgi:hypothetical protein
MSQVRRSDDTGFPVDVDRLAVRRAAVQKALGALFSLSLKLIQLILDLVIIYV